jgi:RNA polymerase sigma factor (sigma-70 family)
MHLRSACLPISATSVLRNEAKSCNPSTGRRYSQLVSMDSTDEAVMVAVREGDLDRLEILFQRYRDPLYDFFSRLTGDRVASEDLVQDVFVRILKYRRSYRESNRFVTWMYQIGRNARADYFRKEIRGPLDSADFPFPSASTDMPSRNVEEIQERKLLQCALLQLSESNRELLILARFQEMKYEDIAALFHIEVGAVKTRVHRAVKELREIFLDLQNKGSSCSATKSETILPTT